MNNLLQVKKLIYYILKNFRYRILVLTLLSLFGGLFEGIGINAFVPLFSFLSGDTSIANGVSSNKFFLAIPKMFSYFGWNFDIKTIFIFIFILFLLRAWVLFFVEYVRIKLILDHEDVTRKFLFRNYLQAGWPFLLKQKLGYFETVVMTDVQQSSLFLIALTKCITIFISLIIYLAIALTVSAHVTLLTMGGSLVLLLLFKPIIRKSRQSSETGIKMKKEIAHTINQSDIGMKAIKAMGSELELSKEMDTNFSIYKKVRVRMKMFRHVTTAVVQPLSLIFVAGVFIVFYRSADYQFASFLVILYLIQKIFTYVEQLQGNFHELNETYPFFKSVLENESIIQKNKEEKKGKSLFQFNNKLEFVDVSFAYKSAETKMTLSQINFEVQKGQFVGIVGPSGAGKTTIVDLLLRFFDPKSGMILLDSVSVRDISLTEWRRHIGYVSQDVFLMNGSIEENIRFHDPSITDAAIEKAVSMAHLQKFIESQKDGISTKVGERGVELSGGQRQRIALARALARNPEILILDEATSALDLESELEITKVIEGLKGKVTVIAIAHRLSTILHADRVIVLRAGEVKEVGNPSDLLKKTDSLFYQIYNT